MLASRRAALSLGGVSLLLGLWIVREIWIGPPATPPRTPRAEILAAAGTLRPCEGRLVGFPFSPLSPKPLSRRAQRRLIAVGVELGERRPPSPQNLADIAMLRLIEGKNDETVSLLRQAVSRSPGDARLWSDLAAVLIAQERTTRRHQDLMQALNAAARAVAADPALPEARFNLALALEKCLLIRRAREAWDGYRRNEQDPDWAAEADRRLEVLSRPPVSRPEDLLERAALHGSAEELRSLVGTLRQPARLVAEERLLPAWAEAWLEKPQEGVEALAAARRLGALLSEATGDRMVQDSVAAIDQALAEDDRERVTALAEGHRAFLEGMRSYRDKLDRKALRLFRTSEASLRGAGSPFWRWAGLRAAMCNLYLPDYENLLVEVRHLALSFERGHHPVLAARLDSVVGIAQGRRGHLAESLRFYLSSLEGFEKAGEVEHIAALCFMIAENLRFQGEIEDAWLYRRRALELAHQAGSSVYFHNTLLDIAEAALQQGLPQAALLTHDEMVQAALEEKDSLVIAEALLRRSRVRVETEGQAAQALERDLEHARLWIEQAPAGERRSRLEADYALAAGEVLLKVRPAQALKGFDAAIRYSQTTGDRFRLSDLLQKRAQAFLALGDFESAEADLRAGIEEYERQRIEIDDLQLQASYFDRAELLFDKMIELKAIQDKRISEAFTYAERFRSRNLLDRVAAEQAELGEALSEDLVRRHLASESALIEYQILEDRLLAWVLTPEICRFVEVRVRRDDLEAMVKAFRSSLKVNGPRAQRLARELHGLLVRPLLSQISGARTLVIVPDRFLHRLPFAALIDEETGRYLLEDRVIGYSPSATIYVKMRQRIIAKEWSREESILTVGNPALDPRTFPTLRPLASAEIEAERIARMYGRDATLLLGAQATSERFLSQAPLHDIIHFAGHSQINPTLPLLSALVLAPGGEKDSGALYARDVYGLSLPRTRLVVLASCGSNLGPLSATEGVASLARPFFVAGAPAIVASLWKVDDKSSTDLLLLFYEHLRQGREPVEALREAQLFLLRKGAGKGPADWAAYELVGGF